MVINWLEWFLTLILSNSPNRCYHHYHIHGSVQKGGPTLGTRQLGDILEGIQAEAQFLCARSGWHFERWNKLGY